MKKIGVLCVLFFLVLQPIRAQKTYRLSPSPAYSKCYELPITNIEPTLWLKNYLLSQKEGLTGNINAAGYPYNTIGWKGKIILPKGYEEFKTWWAYEQIAYWVDGALRCGYFTKDQTFVDSVKSSINYVLKNVSANGILGPQHYGSYKWPHAIFFRAMMAEYYATGNPDIINKLSNHFLATQNDYSSERNIVNIETMCWLYGISGNKTMLDIAKKSFEKYNSENEADETINKLLSDEMPTDHGVSFIELVKVPAILYMYTGESKYLKATINGFEKLDTYHMLIDGIPSSSETLNGKRSNNVHETCDISDYIWSVGYLLMITGDAKWADKIERAAYNAGLGAVSGNFKAHQYYSGPNQFQADDNSSQWNSSATWFDQSRGRIAYSPYHDTECCTGNVNRFMPSLISRMWLTDSVGAIYAAVFGPSNLTSVVGAKNEKVTITETTNYPFGSTIEFKFNCNNKNGLEFPFNIRIPGWSKINTISINGQMLSDVPVPGSYYTIKKKFKTGDIVELNLTMQPELKLWPGNGVAIEYGPLVLAHGITSKTTVSKTNKSFVDGFNSLEIKSTGKWNYALDLENETLLRDVKVIVKPMPQKPWLAETTPIAIQVPAWEISGWGKENGYTPDLPNEYKLVRKDTITLLPMGTQTLRVSIFPDVKKRFTLKQLSEEK